MYSIKQFNSLEAKTVTIEEFTHEIKTYCKKSGKQFEAVMNVLKNSGHDFSVVRLEHDSYKAEITIDNKCEGTLLISKNSVIRYI